MLAHRTIRELVHSLWLAVALTVTLLARSASDKTADGAQPRMLVQSLKHAFKTHPTVRAPVWLRAKHDRLDSYHT